MPARKVASAPLEGRAMRQLIRQLAEGKRTQTSLAQSYGVTPSAVCKFAAKHADEIQRLKDNANAALDDLWIADKAERVKAYQRDAELNERLVDLAENITANAGRRAASAEIALTGPVDEDNGQSVLDIAAEERLAESALRDVPKLQASKHRALRAVAEELGQLPSSAPKVEINDNRVTYELVGLDPADTV